MTQQVLIGGRRSGRVFAFCKAMGWDLKAYQRVTMLLLLFRDDLREFLPKDVGPVSYFEQWKAARKDSRNDWRTVVIDEWHLSPAPPA